MRNNIIHPGADELKYEIREIVEVGNKIQKTGLPIIWENIGDPIAQGEYPPQWIKDIISDTTKNDNSSLFDAFIGRGRPCQLSTPDLSPGSRQ